jgi:hypothetical protein
MASSGMLSRVALVRTDVPVECNGSINRVKGIGELGTTLAVTSNRRTLRRSTTATITATATATAATFVQGIRKHKLGTDRIAIAAMKQRISRRQL